VDEIAAAFEVLLAEERGLGCWIPVLPCQKSDGVRESARSEEPICRRHALVARRSAATSRPTYGSAKAGPQADVAEVGIAEPPDAHQFNGGRNAHTYRPAGWADTHALPSARRARARARTGVSPRATRYAYRPDTDDRRRAIVLADNPDSTSASRITVRSPRWRYRKSNTSAAVTSIGSFAGMARTLIISFEWPLYAPNRPLRAAGIANAY
jgi:hypothetical protein